MIEPDTRTDDSEVRKMEFKKLDEKLKVTGSLSRPGIANPKGESYCNWDQRGHNKESGYTKWWGNGSCTMPGQRLEFEADSKLGKDFFVEFAKIGGKVDGTKLSIEADKFDRVQEILKKPNVDGLTVVGGKHIGSIADDNKDWTKHCYMDGPYGKCVGREDGGDIFLDIGSDTLDKDTIKKLAKADGKIEGTKVKLEKGKLDTVVKELNKK